VFVCLIFNFFLYGVKFMEKSFRYLYIGVAFAAMSAGSLNASASAADADFGEFPEEAASGLQCVEANNLRINNEDGRVVVMDGEMGEIDQEQTGAIAAAYDASVSQFDESVFAGISLDPGVKKVSDMVDFSLVPKRETPMYSDQYIAQFFEKVDLKSKHKTVQDAGKVFSICNDLCNVAFFFHNAILAAKSGHDSEQNCVKALRLGVDTLLRNIKPVLGGEMTETCEDL
jgi:hypothetical protein